MHKFRTYRESIDIDYYVYFTKAYFAFNAYLKEKYPDLNDKDQIAAIQNNTAIYGKFEKLVNSRKHFKDDLISLRDTIEAAAIKNNNKPINLSIVKVGQYTPEVIFNGTFNRTQYYIAAIGGEKFTFKVKNYQSEPFIYENLDSVLQSSSITQAQKVKVKSEIVYFVEQYIINLGS